MFMTIFVIGTILGFLVVQWQLNMVKNEIKISTNEMLDEHRKEVIKQARAAVKNLKAKKKS